MLLRLALRRYRASSISIDFFGAIKPCIKSFLEGCKPYLIIDSTALNGRWNGHLAAACGIDGHN